MIDTSIYIYMIYIYTYLYVFNRRTQMPLYPLLLIHPHIISQLGSHPFKKLQDAYCPHVPRPHHENIASKVHLLPTSVQERDGSLPIEIGWRSSSQFLVPSLSPLGVNPMTLHGVEANVASYVIMSGIRFFGVHHVEKNIQQQLYLYILRTLMYYVLQRSTKTIYSMHKIINIYISNNMKSTSKSHVFHQSNKKKLWQRVATATPRNLYLWIWALHSWKKDGNQLLM